MWKGSIVFFGTRNLEDTHAFYQGLLQLPLERDQGQCRIYGVPGGGGLGFCTHLPVVHQGKSPIITLVTQEVDGVYQRLQKAGISILQEPKENSTFGIYHFFFQDPEAYTIEVQCFLDEA